MRVIIFSLISALCFAFHAIWVKYGLKESDPLTATLISSSINVGFLWILTLSLVPIRSFLNEGIIDSTGILELIMFLEETFDVKIEDQELMPENLDSLNNIQRFIVAKKCEVH